MRLMIVVIIIAALAIAGYLILRPAAQPPMTEEVKEDIKKETMPEFIKLKTSDGVDLAGDYYPASGKAGVILLHMMPSNRKSWSAFAVKLQKTGFSALAIDLRGHGESQGGPSGYQNFSDRENKASILDVEAAGEFFKNKGITNIYLIGSSIGANLALQYLSGNPDARAAVLISPGLDYHGIKTEPFIPKLKPGQGIYLIASDDDTYSLDTVQKLVQEISLSDKRVLRIFQNSGHGNVILQQNPEFADELISWLKNF